MSSRYNIVLYILQAWTPPAAVLPSRMMGHNLPSCCAPQPNILFSNELSTENLIGEFTRSHDLSAFIPSHNQSKTLITPLLQRGNAVLSFEIRQFKHPGDHTNMLAPFPSCLPQSALLTVRSGSDKLSPIQKIQSQ